MSQSLFQLQNGEVIIAKDNKTYKDTYDNFSLDYKNDLVKNKITHAIYNQTLKINIINGEFQEEAENAAFDKIIHDLDVLIAKQTVRNPEPTIPEPETSQQEHEFVDQNVMALAEAVLELSAEVDKSKRRAVQ